MIKELAFICISLVTISSVNAMQRAIKVITRDTPVTPELEALILQNAQEGNTSCQLKLGSIYQERGEAAADLQLREQLENKALHWLLLAAKGNEKWYDKSAEVEALNSLGSIYKTRLDRTVDVEKKEGLCNTAIFYFLLAAQRKHDLARFNLGILYGLKYKITSNLEEKEQALNESIKWSRVAAKSGDINAQNNLGAHYKLKSTSCKNAQEADKYLRKALKWFRKAATSDYGPAQCNLVLVLKVLFLKTNDPKEKNDLLAEYKEWYDKSAQKGQHNVDIAYTLADMFREMSEIVSIEPKEKKSLCKKSITWYKAALEMEKINAGTQAHIDMLQQKLADIKAQEKCDSCNAGNAAKLCGRCKVTRYCNEKCQRAHWGVHKPDCKPANPIKS